MSENTDNSKDNEGPAPSGTAKHALVFVVSCVLGLIVVGLTNYIVNPFANYSPQLFRPMVQQSRTQKVEMLKSLETTPDGLVLGSSRVVTLSPSQLEKLSGNRFVNMGVNSGSVTDFIAIIGLYKEKFDRYPKQIVMGLDIQTFSANRAVDARFLSNSDLRQYADQYVSWNDVLEQYKGILSDSQFVSSFRSLNHWMSGNYPPEKTSWNEDGTIRYLEIEKRKEAGEFDLEVEIEKTKNRHLGRFSQFDRISKTSLIVLDDLMQLAKKEKIDLVIFLPPIHPTLLQELKENTEFDSRKQELSEEFAKLENKYGYSFVDLTEIESFGGTPDGFVDGVHYVEPNCSKVVSKLLGGNKTK